MSPRMKNDNLYKKKSQFLRFNVDIKMNKILYELNHKTFLFEICQEIRSI
jgi:hypothetical protein